MRSYEAARSLFSILAFLAWAVVVLGVIAAIGGSEAASSFGRRGPGVLAAIPGIGICLFGLILVAMVQMGRAAIDTAEYTQQMLKIARDQLDVSRMGLNQGKALEQGFAALKPVLEEKPTASFADATPETNSVPQEVDLEPTAPEIEDFVHRSRLVRAVGNEFIFAGHHFDSVEAAKTHIVVMDGAKPKLPGAFRK